MNFKEILEREQGKEYFVKLNEFIDKEYASKTIYPSKENIYKAFELTSFNNVKVVLIGQDPYHNPYQAQGLAFSVPNDIKTPSSLQNIFKELYNDLGVTKLNNSLVEWAKQGVLLMNTILTVEENKPLAHQNMGWEIFTDTIIKELDKDDSPKVFILWGNYAISKSKLLNNPNHLILTSAHPSGLSCHRGFFGSKPFSKTNKFLKDHNIEPIDWSL